MEWNYVRRCVRILSAGGVAELRIGANSWQETVAIDKIGGDDLKTFCRHGFFECRAPGFRQQLIGLLLCHLSRFLLLDERFDLRLHFINGLHMCVLLVVHVNDMESITALDQIAGGTLW